MKSVKLKKGFLLIETLVALALITIAAASLGRALEQSVRSGQTGTMRLQRDQMVTSWSNRLLSVGFNHGWLSPGVHQKEVDRWALTWKVKDLSTELKQIEMTVDHGSDCPHRVFHKSIYIHGSGWNGLAQPTPGGQ
ncbi:MAG: prepilin-type N-terminal cleavage/methylation domain-containing protein [Candidatus Aminicenantes bacterium]|nr:prepilin-type N-terminal cleavage/methylation domain-containing protein [Candidatus Aminicenantes bacterium]